MKIGQHKKTITEITVFLLVLLWTYTAISKWSDPHSFSFSLHRQPIPSSLAAFLFWALPAIELLASGMLISVKTRTLGLCLSTVLLLIFSIYIALGLAGFFEKIPCACGGVLKAMGWKEHLIFNIILLTLSTYATIIEVKKNNQN
jgi:putative oxidoreductase